MIFKKLNYLIITFVVLLVAGTISCASEDVEISLEECAARVSEFEIQIKKIYPIIKLSNNEFPIALDLITPSLIKNLESYRDIFYSCFIKQVGDGNPDNNIKYCYNKINRPLGSIIGSLRSIEEFVISHAEVIDVSFKYLEKGYLELMQELENQKVMDGRERLITECFGD